MYPCISDRHVFLYAKNHYQRTDVIDDLKVIYYKSTPDFDSQSAALGPVENLREEKTEVVLKRIKHTEEKKHVEQQAAKHKR